VAGRVGLVGTQNIRNNASRIGGLDHVTKTGTIVEAVENQPWSGEANVHVSIVNWMKTQDETLLPKDRKLWFKVELSAGGKKARKKGTGPASKEFELDFRKVEYISSALSDLTDVTRAARLLCNYEPQVCFNGQMLGHKGFVLSAKQASEFIKVDQRNREVIHPPASGSSISKRAQ
jgi:hypothetical protein